MWRYVKDAKNTLNSLEFCVSKIKCLEKELIHLSGQQAYDELMKFFQDTKQKLVTEIKAMPKGVRYIGTFYVRKPNTIPAEFDKIEGSAFIRDDLVRWYVKGNPNYGYCQEIYSSPDLNDRIAKEEAVVVYEE